MILECVVDFEVPIILERPLLATGRALVDKEKGQMKFRLNNVKSTFNICRSMKQSGEPQTVSSVSYKVESMFEVQIKERLRVKELAIVIMNLESEVIEVYGSLVAELYLGEFPFNQKKLELDMKHRESSATNPSIEVDSKIDLKALQPHLRYVFLGRDDTFPIIIASDLNVEQVECLIKMLKRFKRAIGWTIAVIIGFHLVFIHTKSNSCPIISQVLSTKDV